MSGLNLADQTDVNDENGLEVDILTGGDQMYKFFTGEKGKPEPIAYETGLGYVLVAPLICPIEELEQRLISQLHTY